MATHLRTELVLEALDMALVQRRPKDVIHHSDQGSQPRFKGSSQQAELLPVLADGTRGRLLTSSTKVFLTFPTPMVSRATEGRRRWVSREVSSAAQDRGCR